MLKNYLKIAYRQLWKNKGYSLINIGGLALGLASCLLIGLYVLDEWSFDRYHEHAGRIYRLAERLVSSQKVVEQAVTAPPMAPTLEEDFPEVLHAVRLDPSSAIVRYEDRLHAEEDLMYADADVFEVFSWKLKQGDPATALRDPYTVVITEEVARKYFGEADPMGKVLEFDGEQGYTVTGVMEPVPENGHIYFDLLASFESWVNEHPEDNRDAWFWNSFYTYLLLPEDFDPDQLTAKLPEYINRHAREEQAEMGLKYELYLEPLTRIYLHSDINWQLGASGSIRSLYILSAIAGFILLIAVFNFVNLSSAQAINRLKEVGLRKTLGGTRRHLVIQFLGEAMLMSCCAMILAAVLVEFALPPFNTFTGKELAVSWLGNGRTPGILLTISLLVGLLSGAYPAFLLSGFRPVRALQGLFKTSVHSLWVRRGTVVMQFGLSILLIAGAFTIYRQLSYLQSQDLGFDTDDVIAIHFAGDEQVRKEYERIKEQLLQHPDVVKASAGLSVPGRINANLSATATVDGEEKRIGLNAFMVDYDYIDLFELEMAAGRPFSRDMATDTAAYIFNETAIRQFGWSTPEEALGQPVTQNGRDGVVIGVIKDFHYLSLHQRIEPLSLYILPDWFGVLALKLRSGHPPQTLRELEQRWKELVPHRPFDYAFIGEFFNRQYRADRKLGQVVGLFAGLAIFVACLGLLGLAAFTVRRRTKEIGIRKVLGASIYSIVTLLSRDFLWLVLVGMILATPISWYLLQRWLQDFAYHIDMEWWIFPAVGAVAAILALLTICTQSVRAAMANPVEALRDE